jgi:SAM-dependent methyltransferase/uncharacterized protein YbaR (Trm112 family)
MNSEIGSSILDRYRILQTILCCPITKGPLRLVGIDEFVPCLADTERKRVPDGSIGAFVSDANNRAYLLTDRLANFLQQDSIEIQTQSHCIAPKSAPAALDNDIKQSVKAWYDQFGWKKSDLGRYMDTAVYSQDIPEGSGLYELMSHLSILDRLPGGEFVLDAASGAIAHPEYLAFSWFYTSRVCVDMSVTALMEASCKLRQADFCCLADICNLPFRDETFDGAVSGYTIQHIPESQQILAIKELYRVIRPDTHLCVITNVQSWSLRGRLVSMLKAFRKSLELLRLARPIHPTSCAVDNSQLNPPHPLYCHLRKPAWWKVVARQLTDTYSIESLRLLSKSEFDRLFGTSNRAVHVLRLIESAFPKWTSRVSVYCLIDIRKNFNKCSTKSSGSGNSGASDAN